MHPFPHQYSVWAVTATGTDATLESDRLPPLRPDVPHEFGGAGDRWSPETLLVAAVADCYALTFRGMAGKSTLPWTSLACHVVGTLDRVDDITRFVGFQVHASLQVPEGTSEQRARRILVKAEDACLITRSLSARITLETVVEAAIPQPV
jgi:organic hydroperoxide reductase OsmC/OhrA